MKTPFLSFLPKKDCWPISTSQWLQKKSPARRQWLLTECHRQENEDKNLKGNNFGTVEIVWNYWDSTRETWTGEWVLSDGRLDWYFYVIGAFLRSTKKRKLRDARDQLFPPNRVPNLEKGLKAVVANTKLGTPKLTPQRFKITLSFNLFFFFVVYPFVLALVFARLFLIFHSYGFWFFNLLFWIIAERVFKQNFRNFFSHRIHLEKTTNWEKARKRARVTFKKINLSQSPRKSQSIKE